jgi:YD repeat-containing protein
MAPLHYNDAGRLISKNYPDTTQQTYTYDSNSNLLQAVNPAVAMRYTYDARNLQLTITNDTIGMSASYTYDELGRKISLTYPDGEILAYTRDQRGQVSDFVSNQPGPEGEPPPAVEYIYNADSTLSHLNYGFGMKVDHTYDSAGRVIDLEYTKPNTTLISKHCCPVKHA